jgi:lysophospholipase L1-like esterase
VLLAATACGAPPVVSDRNGDGKIVVACLGDSNTDRHWPPPDTPKWCELAADRVPDWTFVNRAVSGARVSEFSGPEGWSGTQLDATLPMAPDAVVLAFGTNDVRFGRSAADVVAAYRAAVARIEATGAVAFVALAPPIHPPEPEHAHALDELNAALRAAFPAARVIDFASGMTRADFGDDGLHPNDDGQRKRAEAALRALRPSS